MRETWVDISMPLSKKTPVVEGVRPRGIPKLRNTDTNRRDIKKNGLTDVNILNRKDWRMAVSRATVAPLNVKTTLNVKTAKCEKPNNR